MSLKKLKYNNSVEFVEILFIMFIFSIMFMVMGGWKHCLTEYNLSDLGFHLNRTIGLSEVLVHPINYKSFNQLGSGINYFYPWLTLYPAILLIKFTHSVVNGYLLFLILMNVFSGVISYYSLKSVYKSRLKALTFSVMFIFLTYRSLDIFRRFDIGECLAMTFMLIVFSAIINVIMDNQSAWIKLSVGMSLILYSHLLSAVIVAIMCILIFILSWKYIHNWKFVIDQFVKSIVSTFFLTLGFVLPYLQQSRLGINPPFLGILSSSALSLSHLWDSSLNNTLGSNHYTAVSLGILCLIFLVIGLFKWGKTPIESIFYTLGLISVILSTKLFPWNLFQKYCSLLQFPWRFLELASVFLLIYGVSIFLNSKNKLISLGLILCSMLFFYSSVHDLEITAMNKTLDSTKLTKILDCCNSDYCPQKSVGNSSIWRHKFYDSDGNQIPLIHHATNDKYFINLHSYQSKVLDTPLYYYYGVEAKSHNENLDIEESSRGTIKINNPPQYGLIEITSKYTLLAKISQIISFFSIIVLCVFKIIYLYYKR